jgi:hypothetical protein
MAQFILGLLALVAGLWSLAYYFIDLHLAATGASSAQPNVWLLILAGALFVLSAGLCAFAILKI